MKKKRLITVVLCFLILTAVLPSVAVKSEKSDSRIELVMPGSSSSRHDLVPEGYRIIAEDSNTILYYKSDVPSVMILDKRNNKVWSSSVTEDEYDLSNVSTFLKSSMNSLLHIGFMKRTEETSRIIWENSSNNNVEVTEKPLENGIKIYYNFANYKVRMAVEIYLEKDTLLLRIPIDDIHEEGNYGLVSVRTMPFFGAANNRRNGYVFYPDGCGALSYFNSQHPAVVDGHSWYIYGSDAVDIDKYEQDQSQNIKTAMLPVFGVKKDENAFIGIIYEGEHEAAIKYDPSGVAVELNRIYCEFTYRRLHNYTTSDTRIIKCFEKDIIPGDHAVRYLFLAGEDTDYSGMANAYRNYLLESGNIKRNINSGDKIPLAIDLFMGIKEERILIDKYIPMTTFEQAIEILDQFKERGVDSLQVNLIGWTKGGYGLYPQHLPPENKLGGEFGLRKLSEYTVRNGIILFLQDNFVDAYKNNRGFSARKDVVQQKNSNVVTNRWKNEFWLNPFFSLNYFLKDFLPKVGSYRINGIVFEKFGYLTFYDYHKSNPSRRDETSSVWQKFMDESRKTFGMAAVQGGNAYMLKVADRLYDVPSKDTGYFFSDETVPFYQMVVHGLIPYCFSPGNLFYDPPYQKLKWVEYGSMPYYHLTYRDAKLLKYTDYKWLFSSGYAEWIDQASEYYKEFNERLKDTWSQMIIKHEKLNDKIFKVSYENGISVYINYGNDPATVEEVQVGAMDYIVVDKEGRQK